MEVFKPIKVENYQFMKNGLNQYEPVLVYFKDDEEEGKVYFVILWREQRRLIWLLRSHIKEGFRNFDLKNLEKKGFRISN